MKNNHADIFEMLDSLSLPVAAQRFADLSESPELGNYTAMQFLREILEPQYIETLNNRFETNLRLSSLIIKRCPSEKSDNRKWSNLQRCHCGTGINVSFRRKPNRTSESMELPVQASHIFCLPAV